MPGIRSTARWQRLTAHLIATRAPHCQAPICASPHGRWIDVTLDRLRHPWSVQVDHIIELEDGGEPYDPDNLALTHRSCNIGKGNKARAQRNKQPRLRPSRDW